MNIKKYLKELITSLIIIVASTFIISILNYFNIFNKTILGILKLIVILISVFYPSYKLGKLTQKNGYLEGIKFGGIILVLFSIFNIIAKNNFDYKTIIYYIILFAISTIGSMIGISRKRNNN